MIDLEAIKARYQATLGDWRIERLISASWNDIPALIAEVERLQQLADARLKEIGRGIQDEQEACARIAETLFPPDVPGITPTKHVAGLDIADRIRARGNQ